MSLLALFFIVPIVLTVLGVAFRLAILAMYGLFKAPGAIARSIKGPQEPVTDQRKADRQRVEEIMLVAHKG